MIISGAIFIFVDSLLSSFVSTLLHISKMDIVDVCPAKSIYATDVH